MQFRHTFHFLLHLKVVLKEEHAAGLSEAAAKHSIVLDALVTHIRSLLVQNCFIHLIAGKIDPVRRQKADSASQKSDS